VGVGGDRPAAAHAPPTPKSLITKFVLDLFRAVLVVNSKPAGIDGCVS